MNVTCSAEPCPILLNASCVFYTGGNLIYTGIVTNDNLETALQKIDAKFGDAGLGYIFTNGITQSAPGQPVKLGGTLVQNTTITNNGYTFTFTEDVIAAKHITAGGTSSQFVKGDGTLDSTSYQPVGNYITALTGDGTASGPGTAVFTLSPVSALYAGTWGSATTVPQFTIDAKGRVIAVTNVPISLPAPAATFIGDVFGSGSLASNITLTIANVLSTPGTYGSGTTVPVVSVNSKGQITAVSSTPILVSSGTVTNVSVTPGTGISASVTNPTTTPNITITNTAPDQTVVLNSGTGINVSGSYPNFTITNTSPSSGGTVTSIATSSPITGGTITTTGTIGITQASGVQDGYLSSADWTTFNSKANYNTSTSAIPVFNGTIFVNSNILSSSLAVQTTPLGLYVDIPNRLSILGDWGGTGNTTTLFVDDVGQYVSVSTLSGVGTRMVVADSFGTLSTQSIPTGTITGSGTTNYLPKFTSSTALGNSLIYDNGTSLGVGTASPNASSLLDMTSTTQGLLVPRMTTAQINAISSPAQGLLVFNTDDNALLYYDNDLGGWWSDNPWWVSTNGIFLIDDFVTYSATNGANGNLFQFSTGGGIVNATVPLSNRPGILRLSTSTSATGRASIILDNNSVASFIVGGGKLIYETDVLINTLSTTTEAFRFFTGFSSSNGNPALFSISFLYDSEGVSTGSAASGNWQVLCANNSVRSYLTTTTTVVAGVWYRLKIEINAAGNSVNFYINGTLANTIATNIPTSNLTPVSTIVKSNGTTARTAWNDFIRIKQKFTTVR